jgi:predicted metal-binding membrane protein
VRVEVATVEKRWALTAWGVWRIVRNMRPHEPVSERAAPQGMVALVATQPRRTLGILAVSMIGWLFLAWIAIDMGHPVAQLTMPDSSSWSAASILAIWLMWALMMAAMMLPSALPMILTFVQLAMRAGERGRARGFVAAYLLVWFAFSAAATGAQWALQAMGWVDPMIVSRSAWLTAVLLLVAGLYQFSPLKRVCLSHCRTPMGFLLGEWRPGASGAFVMGARHGLFCVGCCWALMALLFVGGVMNLAWIAALSIAVAIEKLAPRGERLAAALGIALIAAGLVKMLALPF